VSGTLSPPVRARWIDRAARAAVLGRLQGLRDGRLEIVEPGGSTVLGDPASPLRATLEVLHPGFWSDAAFRGSVGAGESYVEGRWAADDLTALVRILARNREVLDGLESGLARLGAPALRAFHALRANTVAGSRRNIAAHYDLGDDFFALFLDPTLSYSCAIYGSGEESLEQAQVAKVERALGRLGLGPSHHLLEIGTGWGFLAVHAASRYGCRVTTTTISERQHAYATERVARAGLADRVNVIRRDWRDLEGRYDRLVSIEMVEAIGWRLLPPFFRKCAALLAPGGSALVQSITIDDALYERARRSVDFIQRYVFPGSCIPSRGSIERALEGTGLRIAAAEEIGPHYARTLREWRLRLLSRAAEARALGFDGRAIRLWEFYFAYCEGGFEERALGDAQFLLAGPGA